ncbi:schwannomin-interacting protein 1 homolog isoform X2 [Diachasma alloeum]|uniref:schwannomin-interacting protein 1 homolog isoform X2 n=1 Tax=Diachasma alloeum TaxID=454923 RepID=UPI0007382ABE|nr:schwannomin-interacting protein 1 homolog isoform X2 [Diachasma alloeum]
MRIKDVLAPVVIHPGLNNNQIERQSHDNQSIPSTSDQLENFNSPTTKPVPYDENYEIQDFRIAEDTTTWSSVAVARTNVNVNSKHLNSIINNNNLSVSRLSLSSSAESLSDYEAHELSGGSDCSDNSEEGSVPGSCRGIINPNYPGFQHLAPSFLSIFGGEEQPPDSRHSSPRIDEENFEKEEGQNNNQDHSVGDSVNRLDGRKSEHKFFYEKPKLNIQTVTSYYEGFVSPSEKCLNYVKSIGDTHTDIQETSASENDSALREEHQTHWNNIPVEIEFAELQSSSTERPQFAQIEEIPPESAGKNPEQDSETEEQVIERIDVIPESTEIPVERKTEESETNTDSEGLSEEQLPYKKLEEIDLLSSIGRDIGVDLEKYVQPVPDVVAMEAVDVHSRPLPGLVKDTLREDTNKLVDLTQDAELSVDCRKKEKMVRNQARRRQQGHGPQRHSGRTDKRRMEQVERAGGFDVYNIETAMPKIDLDAIESHLRAAREEERRRRNDREEIRRRLAMGPDADDIRLERGRKPSLQSRLQSGMNLQICFMNETPSDTESPNSDSDSPLNAKQSQGNGYQSSGAARPQVLSLPPLRLETDISSAPLDEADFFARQARLQTEARMALAQAKEMAHMQMEVERQRLKQSPITEMVRCSLEKVGVQLGETRRRLSRALLTELNVAQLQVIANDLHARIAVLNEALVEGLLRRDDLHMEQDSMLVDVEDLTRYLNK